MVMTHHTGNALAMQSSPSCFGMHNCYRHAEKTLYMSIGLDAMLHDRKVLGHTARQHSMQRA